jgi:hypothetical protein
MHADNVPSYKWPGDPFGRDTGGTHYAEYDVKSGSVTYSHDTGAVPPSICPRCDIPILPGYGHSSLDQCFISLIAFVKLCQDEIEESRMQTMEHPTREELIQDLRDIAEQFRKLSEFSDRAIALIQKNLRVTL